MPLESRIQSERARQTVIAIIMFALLVIATVTAVALTGSRDPSDASAPTANAMPAPEHEPVFSYQPPANWVLRSVRATSQGRPATIYINRNADDERVAVIEYVADQPVDPRVALGKINELIAPTPTGTITVGQTTINEMVALVRSWTASKRRLWRTEHTRHVLLLMTPDGQHYLTLYLSGIGKDTPDDRKRLTDFATTVRFIAR